MSPDQWREARQIFEEALDKEPAAREAFVRESCKDNQRLFEEVASLLASYDQADDIFLNPVIEGVTQTDRLEGRQLGPYRTLHRLGQGGMGAAYLGERADDQFRRRVAIKLIRPGYDDGQMLRRFRNERQLLAVLDHPNIVKLLDAGVTDDGIPYFVMDYVEGQPIDKYCEARALTIPERLELFRAVCDAVHCAHRNLVVHRDLKPSNILVTPEGVPKLLDFGIAKLLRPEYGGGAIGLTRTLQPMTAEFASPEQVTGQPITTSSDVYSLGVLLYRLITGRHPYEMNTSSAADVERAICETNPSRPSALVRSAPGRKLAAKDDLDNIVLMAMRKEPQRRYASAEHLSEDIRRYLTNLPVTARKDTTVYRASKFVRRHALGVAAVTLAAVLLIASAAYAWSEKTEAERQRTRAEAELAELKKTALFMLFDLDDEFRLKGPTAGRELMATKALEQVDKLANAAGGDQKLKELAAIGYLRVGNIQGNPTVSNNGKPEEARVSYAKSLQMGGSMKPGPHADLAITKAHIELGRWEVYFGSQEEADKHFQAATKAAGNLDEAKNSLMIVMEQMGKRYEMRGDQVTAAQYYAGSLDSARELEGSKPSDLRRSNTQKELQLYSLALARTGHTDDAVKKLQQSLTGNLAKRDRASTYGCIGYALALAGQTGEAIDAYQQSIGIFQQVTNEDLSDARARMDLGLMKGELAGVLATAKRLPDAARSMSEALTFLKPAMGQPHQVADILREYAEFLLADYAHSDAAEALVIAKRADEQEKHRNPATLEVLAHAYLAAVDRAHAQETAKKGLALLPAGCDAQLRKKLEGWLSAQKP